MHKTNLQLKKGNPKHQKPPCAVRPALPIPASQCPPTAWLPFPSPQDKGSPRPRPSPHHFTPY